MKANILIIIFILLNTPLAVAQQVWSLDDCIQYAISHNLSMNELKYNVASEKENHRQSVRELLPSVSGFTNYTIQMGRAVDPNDNSIVNINFFSNNYSLNASLDIFQAFQKQHAIRSAKLIHQATKEAALHQEYLLILRVVQAYYDVQYFDGLLAIAKEQNNLSERNYDLVKRQIELGVKAGADLYEVEAAWLADKLRVTQAENSRINARFTLMREMNLKANEGTQLEVQALEITATQVLTSMPLDSIYLKARQFVPNLKAQQLRINAENEELLRVKGSFFPSIALGGGYGTGYYETTVDSEGRTVPFGTQIKDNASSFVGISMSIPISDRWTTRSRVKQQEINIQRAQNSLALQEQELYQLLQQLVQDQRALQAEYQQSQQKMKAQELSFKIAQKRYGKGLIPSIELQQAQSLLATAQLENLQVYMKIVVNRTTLDFYKGLHLFK